MNFDFTFDNVFPLVFLLLTAFFFLKALWNIASAIQSRDWPEASGVMLSSDLEESRGSRGRRLYKAVVAYRFHALGQEIVGHRACFGDSNATNFQSFATRITRKYRAGQTVTVRYNPRKPEECVLETSVNPAMLMELAMSGLFLVIGFFMWRGRT